MTNSKSWGWDPGACKSPLGATDPAQGIKAARLRDKTGNSPQKIQGWFSLPASVYRQKPGLWQIPQRWPHLGNWCERRCSVPACLAQCGPRRASFASCKSCPMVDLRKAENCSGAGKSSVSVWVWNRENYGCCAHSGNAGPCVLALSLKCESCLHPQGKGTPTNSLRT